MNEPAPRVWHRGGKRPVLMLHCSLAHSGAWAGVAGLLDGVTAVAPDLPGHGRRPVWDGRGDIHGITTRAVIALAAELAEGAAGAGGAGIDLVGHSFGATVALRLAMERPDLIRSLVLIEPVLFAAARAAGAPAFPAFLAQHHRVLAALQRGENAAAATLFHAGWGAGGTFDDLPERQRRYMIDRMSVILGQNPELLDDAANMLGYGRPEAVGIPVLLLEGGASPEIMAAVQTELARRLPQSRRVVVPGAGHMVPITHPAQVAAAIMAHLAAC